MIEHDPQSEAHSDALRADNETLDAELEAGNQSIGEADIGLCGPVKRAENRAVVFDRERERSPIADLERLAHQPSKFKATQGLEAVSWRDLRPVIRPATASVYCHPRSLDGSHCTTPATGKCGARRIWERVRVILKPASHWKCWAYGGETLRQPPLIDSNDWAFPCCQRCQRALPGHHLTTRYWCRFRPSGGSVKRFILIGKLGPKYTGRGLGPQRA
jgi:hypothetical protein